MSCLAAFLLLDFLDAGAIEGTEWSQTEVSVVRTRLTYLRRVHHQVGSRVDASSASHPRDVKPALNSAEVPISVGARLYRFFSMDSSP